MDSSSSSSLLHRRLPSLADSDSWEAEEKEAAASEKRHVDCHLLLPRLRPERGRGKHRRIYTLMTLLFVGTNFSEVSDLPNFC